VAGSYISAPGFRFNSLTAVGAYWWESRIDRLERPRTYISAAARSPTTSTPLMTTRAIRIGEVPLPEPEFDAEPEMAPRLLRSLDPDPEVALALGLEVEAALVGVAVEVEVEVCVDVEVEVEVAVELLLDAEAVEIEGSLRAALDGFAFPDTTGWCCRTGWEPRVSPQRARHSSVPRAMLSGMRASRPPTSSTPRPPRVAPTISGGNPKYR